MDLKRAFKESSRTEIIVLIIVSLQYSMFALGYIGIPFWFMDSKFECRRLYTGTDPLLLGSYNTVFESCSEKEYCAYSLQNEGYRRIAANSPFSISQELGLYCDKKFIKVSYVTYYLLSFPLASLFWSAIVILPSWRGYYLAFFYILCGIVSIAITHTQHPSMILLGLIMFRFLSKSHFVNIFAFVNENFSDHLVEVAAAIISSFWGLGSISLAIFFYFIPNWKYLMIYYSGIPMIISSIFLIYYLHKYNFFPSKEVDIKVTTMSNMVMKDGSSSETEEKGTLLELLKDPTILRNTVIFLLLFHTMNGVFTELTLILDDFYGGIYINLFIFGVSEVIICFYSGKLLQKFDGLKLVSYSMIALSLFCLIFIIKSFQFWFPLYVTLLIIGVLGIKFCIEAGCAFLLSIQHVFVPIKFLQVMWSFTNIFDVVYMAIPILNFFIELININPLIVFGFLSYGMQLLIKKVYQYASPSPIQSMVSLKDAGFLEKPSSVIRRSFAQHSFYGGRSYSQHFSMSNAVSQSKNFDEQQNNNNKQDQELIPQENYIEKLKLINVKKDKQLASIREEDFKVIEEEICQTSEKSLNAQNQNYVNTSPSNYLKEPLLVVFNKDKEK